MSGVIFVFGFLGLSMTTAYSYCWIEVPFCLTSFVLCGEAGGEFWINIAGDWLRWVAIIGRWLSCKVGIASKETFGPLP